MNKEEDWKEISRKIIRAICLMDTKNKRQEKIKIKILLFAYKYFDNEEIFNNSNILLNNYKDEIKRVKKKR